MHEEKLARLHLAFTWDRRNWTAFWMAKCASLGPKKSRSQTCTLSRSKLRPVPPVPCKRKVEPCKFLSVQKFVRTRVNAKHWNSIVHVLLPRDQIMYTRLLWTKNVLFIAIGRQDGDRILLKQRLEARKKLHFLSRFTVCFLHLHENWRQSLNSLTRPLLTHCY